MSLSDKTKVGMTIGQLIALVAFVFSVSGGFAVVNESATQANKKADANIEEIKELKKAAQQDRQLMMQLIQEVRESQIRIEGKLDLKQDKKFD